MARRRRPSRTLGQAPLQSTAASPSTRAGASGLLTPKELAAQLKVSVVNVRRLLKEQQLPFFRVGKRVRFKLGDVLQALPKFDPPKNG